MAWFYSQRRSIDSLIPLILPFQSMANKPSSEFSLRLILKKIVFSTDQRNTSFYECLGYSWSSVLDPGSGYRGIFGLTPTKRVTFIGADLNHVLSGLLTHKYYQHLCHSIYFSWDIHSLHCIMLLSISSSYVVENHTPNSWYILDLWYMLYIDYQLLLTQFNFKPAWISKYVIYKMWD